MTYQELADSRIYWKGLANDALALLEVLKSHGMTVNKHSTLFTLPEISQRASDLVKKEGA